MKPITNRRRWLFIVTLLLTGLLLISCTGGAQTVEVTRVVGVEVAGESDGADHRPPGLVGGLDVHDHHARDPSGQFLS